MTTGGTADAAASRKAFRPVAAAGALTGEQSPIRSEDREQFLALYAEHFSGLFDFASRLMRDEEAAADVVQETFARAWTALTADHPPRHWKAWLYTVARHAAIDDLRRQTRESGGSRDDRAGAPFAMVTDPGPAVETLAQRHELAALVWEAAAALKPADYALLDLAVRRELSPEELADAFAVSRGAIYTRLSRLRQAVGEAVAVGLLARHGRQTCGALAEIVVGAEPLDRATVRRVRRHAAAEA